MRKYRTYHFTTYTDSGYELDIIMTDDDVIRSDWGRNYFLTVANPTEEQCIEKWKETFMATEIEDSL